MTANTDEKETDLKKKFAENLILLQKQCEEFEGDDNYIYKLARDVSNKKDTSRKWLVIMRKTKDSITNESRKGIVDEKYAKFRANELEVIKIINVNNPNLTKKCIVNEYDGMRTVYKTSQVAKSKWYDQNLDIVCSDGIHYFKTMLAAYYYAINRNYSGHWIKWHANGGKQSDGEYLNGKQTNTWTYWYENGEKELECEYFNGKRTGRFTEWYDNKKKKSEGEYLEGREVGYWTYWYKNGEKKSDGTYLHGERTDIWIYYHGHIGKKRVVGRYTEGLKSGIWTYWYDNDIKGVMIGEWTVWHNNGIESSKGNYSMGKKEGVWTYWYDNKEIEKQGTYLNDRENGTWTFYHKDEKLKFSRIYDQS